MLEIKDKDELKSLVNEILTESVGIELVNKSLNPLPEYKTAGSAGLDLRANLPSWRKDIHFPPHSKLVVSTGIYIKLPKGFEAHVRSRSGLAAQQGIFVLNSPGTIDSDYTGEIMVILYNISDIPFTIRQGDRIAQLVITRHSKASFVEVEELNEDSSERKSGGLGSTGIK